jgi:hypothetical protein
MESKSQAKRVCFKKRFVFVTCKRIRVLAGGDGSTAGNIDVRSSCDSEPFVTWRSARSE